MNLNQLTYFCEAVRQGSVTGAAKKLYVTQPAVSGAIRELEKEFNVELIDHTRNRLVLTRDGERFFDRAELLLRQAAETERQFRDLSQDRPPVRVGIPPLWGTAFFPGLLRDFRAAYPDIRLTFYEYGSARAAALVGEEELDVALVNLRAEDPERFHSALLGRDHLVVVMDPQHPLASREKLTLEELAGERFVMYNTDSVQNTALRSRFDRLGIVPEVLLYTSQIVTMKGVLHSEPAVGFFFASLLGANPDLKGVPLDPPIEQRVGLLWRKGRYVSGSTEAFVKFVREYPLFPD